MFMDVVKVGLEKAKTIKKLCPDEDKSQAEVSKEQKFSLNSYF